MLVALNLKYVKKICDFFFERGRRTFFSTTKQSTGLFLPLLAPCGCDNRCFVSSPSCKKKKHQKVLSLFGRGRRTFFSTTKQSTGLFLPLLAPVRLRQPVFRFKSFLQKEKAPKGAFSFWQGQKDLNPRHAVLETAALPTELYP